MSESAHELLTQDSRLLLAKGKGVRFLALIVALVGLQTGNTQAERSQFPTTIDSGDNRPWYMIPKKAPMKVTNDDCVIEELSQPNELTSA